MKKAAFFLLLPILFLLLDHAIHEKEHRFTLSKVVSFMGNHSDFKLPPASAEEKEEIKQILNQPFTAFDKGAQSYVFISADGQYILKLFKQHKLRPATWTGNLVNLLPDQHYKYKYKRKKFKEALLSCKNAFIHFKKETGLLYVHLNKGADICQEVTCISEQGETISVPLDQTVFVLQRKAELLYPSITRKMEGGDVEGAKQVISSMISLLYHLGAEGVYDNDPALEKNFGILDGQAIQIDVGKFLIDKTTPFRENIRANAVNLEGWLTLHYPELLSHLSDTLAPCP